MTREQFIKVLEDIKGYSYEIERDKLVVTGGDKYGCVYLPLETLPPGVVFKNGGYVGLESLKTLPPGVEFNNGGYVDLGSLVSLPSDVEFKNRGNVNLASLKTLPPGVVFKNRGGVWLGSLIGGSLKDWSGNIKGIDSKRLLKHMISKGMFI